MEISQRSIIESIYCEGKPALMTDNFIRHQVIGKGGFCLCYRLQSCLQDGKPSGKFYAGKCFKKYDIFQKPEDLKGLKQKDPKRKPITRNKLEQEIRFLMSFRNKFIVKYVKTIVDKTDIYLILQLCDQSLHDHIKKKQQKRLDKSDAYRIFYQLAQAVKYLHDRRIIHRDLKPGNILLTGNGDVKLSDFGLSKIFSDKNKQFMKGCAGTQGYKAPQVMNSTMQYSYGIDIWSMGVILFQLLTGNKPFNSKNYDDLCLQIKKLDEIIQKYRQLIDQNADKLICEIFQLDAKDRPTINNILSGQFLLNNLNIGKEQILDRKISGKSEIKKQQEMIIEQQQVSQIINNSQCPVISHLEQINTKIEDQLIRQQSVIIKKLFSIDDLMEIYNLQIVKQFDGQINYCYLMTNNEFGVWFWDDVQILSSYNQQCYFVIEEKNTGVKMQWQVKKIRQFQIKQLSQSNNELAQRFKLFSQLKQTLSPLIKLSDKNTQQQQPHIIQYEYIEPQVLYQYINYPRIIWSLGSDRFVILKNNNVQSFFSDGTSLVIPVNKDNYYFLNSINEQIPIQKMKKSQLNQKLKFTLQMIECYRK